MKNMITAMAVVSFITGCASLSSDPHVSYVERWVRGDQEAIAEQVVAACHKSGFKTEITYNQVVCQKTLTGQEDGDHLVGYLGVTLQDKDGGVLVTANPWYEEFKADGTYQYHPATANKSNLINARRFLRTLGK